MTNFSKYDIVVVKFPFASSLKYKARPAVILSSNIYNQNSRDTLLILAISSKLNNKLDFESELIDWQTSGLLKPSIFKASIATIEKEFAIKKLGSLSQNDINKLENLISIIC
ncbi:MAG: type II toxin-antitoxin system PemK/MazF family toxin [Campylobacterota bacterium]|nr:type II toxin-antitoxin system PemK/MazF family toxin [Campylobacterota bacterium]